MSNFNIFKQVLCDNSESDNYYDSVNEWRVTDMFKQPNSCICGVKIITNYEITNINNDNTLIIGKICAKKFLNNNLRLVNDIKRLIYNDQCKNKNKLYRKCNTCNIKYGLDHIEEHDILSECFECNPISHVKRFNDLCNNKKLPVRKCIECTNIYKLKNNKYNTWQIHCIKCYKQMKKTNVHIKKCFDCN